MTSSRPLLLRTLAREPVERPLCGFYEGVIVKLMELIGIQAEVRLARCRAAGGNTCQIQLFWDASRVPAPMAPEETETRARSRVLTE